MLKIIKAYAIQMSYDVSDSEKTKAEQALLYFKASEKLLKKASDHLNIMKTPFKENPDMTTEDVMSARAAIRRFRDTVIENFNEFKVEAFRCVHIMQHFSSDTQTVKLMKSFITSVDSLEVLVNEFADLFTDLQSKDFSKNIVVSMESIQKECNGLDKIIDERIVNHIQTNILSKNWTDSISNDLQMKVEQKTPLILDLFNKRQEQLNELIKERGSSGN
jgi:hypothetical protein